MYVFVKVIALSTTLVCSHTRCVWDAYMQLLSSFSLIQRWLVYLTSVCNCCILGAAPTFFTLFLALIISIIISSRIVVDLLLIHKFLSKKNPIMMLKNILKNMFVKMSFEEMMSAKKMFDDLNRFYEKECGEV